MTVHNNDVLFNAACLGIAAGVLHGEDFTQITAATLAGAEGLAQTANIAAAATEIDSLIANDHAATDPLSVITTGYMNVAPFAGVGTAAQIMPFFSKPELLSALCEAAFAGQDPQSATPGDYRMIASGIVAEYTALAAALDAS